MNGITVCSTSRDITIGSMLSATSKRDVSDDINCVSVFFSFLTDDIATLNEICATQVRIGLVSSLPHEKTGVSEKKSGDDRIKH